MERGAINNRGSELQYSEQPDLLRLAPLHVTVDVWSQRPSYRSDRERATGLLFRD
jgi:hypothetical protein